MQLQTKTSHGPKPYEKSLFQLTLFFAGSRFMIALSVSGPCEFQPYPGPGLLGVTVAYRYVVVIKYLLREEEYQGILNYLRVIVRL
jgi:hypothetical protein